MLCEVCHERDASVHTGTGSEGTFSRHFCQQCFQERGPIPGVQIVEGVEQTCHYCGRPCGFGSARSGKVSVEIPGAVTCCRECGEDFNYYLQNHIGEPSSEEEFVRDLEAFMKKRVAEREAEQ